MKIYSGHYLWFFCAGRTFILFAEYFRPYCEALNVTAPPAARPRPHAESDNVTAAAEEVSSREIGLNYLRVLSVRRRIFCYRRG
jgi:hypothetical protein